LLVSKDSFYGFILKASSLNIEIGTIIDGRYEIVFCLGHGGMGTVYKALDQRSEKYVAIKFISQDGLDDQRRTLRFKREAIATARLHHPSIAKVLDFGLINGLQPYLVMEFVEGKTLSSMIAEEGQLSLSESLSIFTTICDGLAHAHENKVLHRDLKPSNIMVNRDLGPITAKILDFGIAKILESAGVPSQQITRTGELLGSPFYMSPEQAKGGHIDHRSDLYSLGCTMYEALTGGPPHVGDSPVSTLLKRESHEPLPLAEASLGRQFPEQLEIIVAKLLKNDPDKRYQSAYDLKRDLLKIGEEPEANMKDKEAIVQEKQTVVPPGLRAQKKSRWVPIAAIALLVLACAVPLALLNWPKPAPIIKQAQIPPPMSSLEEEEGRISQAADSLKIEISRNQAGKLKDAGDFEKAERAYLRIINTASPASGDIAEQIAKTRVALALLYQETKQYGKASQQLKQARTYFEKTVPADESKLAYLYTVMAEGYRYQATNGDRSSLNEAIALYEKAGSYYEKHLPQTNKQLIACLTEELSAAWLSPGIQLRKYVMFKLFTVKVKQLSFNHPEIVKLLRDLGGLSRAQHKYEDAIGFDKRVLAAYDLSSDQLQPGRVEALIALASDYLFLSKDKNAEMLKSALKYYMQALTIGQRDHSLSEAQTAETLENIGQVYLHLGQFESNNYAEAERFTARALKAYQRLPNFDKQASARLLIRMGDLEVNQKHLANAVSTYLQALPLAIKVYGANSKTVCQLYWQMSEYSRGLGKLNEADGYYERALPLTIHCYGRQTNNTADVLGCWSENARLQGNLPKSRKLLADCLSIRRHTLGYKNPTTVLTESALKNIDASLKQPTNPEPPPSNNSNP
jgi:serine/threonine protein kinase